MSEVAQQHPVSLSAIDQHWCVIAEQCLVSGHLRWDSADADPDAQFVLGRMRNAGAVLTAQARRLDGRFVLLARRRANAPPEAWVAGARASSVRTTLTAHSAKKTGSASMLGGWSA
jgi:hypothetical protein